MTCPYCHKNHLQHEICSEQARYAAVEIDHAAIEASKLDKNNFYEITKKKFADMCNSGPPVVPDKTLLNDIYKTTFRCLNCAYTGILEIQKGTLVRKTKCPLCGCTPDQVSSDD